jgi:hypothetical protein
MMLRKISSPICKFSTSHPSRLLLFASSNKRAGRLLTSYPRYDGDENNGPNTNVTAPPPAAQPTPNEAVMTSHGAAGYGEEPETSYDAISFETEAEGQDEPANGNQHDMQVQDTRDMAPQQERFNVNMKEDG